CGPVGEKRAGANRRVVEAFAGVGLSPRTPLALLRNTIAAIAAGAHRWRGPEPLVRRSAVVLDRGPCTTEGRGLGAGFCGEGGDPAVEFARLAGHEFGLAEGLGESGGALVNGDQVDG